MALNVHSINSESINGAGNVAKTGAGTLIYLAQKIEEVESGTLIICSQIVGFVGSGSLIPLAQTIQQYNTASGEIITVNQAVVVHQVSSSTIITINQQVRNPAVADHFSRTGWDVTLTLNNVPVPTSQLAGKIQIDRSESQAALMTVNLILPSGGYDVSSYCGQTVTLDIHTAANGVKRAYTGTVDYPTVDLINRVVTLKCTDLRTELINDQLVDTVVDIGYFSPIIFQTVVDTADELDKRLSTTPYSVDFDVFGNYTLTSWFAKATPDFTLTNSDVYYAGPKVEYGSRGRVVNQVNITFQYRYPRLHQWARPFQWTSPIDQSIDFLLIQGYSITLRSQITNAISGANWPLVHAVSYTPIWKSGVYNGIIWSTIALSGTSSGDTDKNGDPIKDSGGNLAAITSQSGTDYSLLYCMAAAWTASTRWAQTITETQLLSVNSPQSQATYGVIDTDESYSTTNNFDTSVWENYKSFSDPDGLGDGNYFIDKDTDRTDIQNAEYVAIAKANTTILASHRDTKVTITTFLHPEFDLSNTIYINTTAVQAKGKVYTLSHMLDIGTGEATTTTSISIFKAAGSTTATPLVLPVSPNGYIDPGSDTIILGNHFGQDPTKSNATSWNGYIGNCIVSSKLGPTTFQEQFIIDTPVVPDINRQELAIGVTSNYNVVIPNDTLEVFL